MGNYQFKVPNPPGPGTIVTIHDDRFSKENEVPPDLLHTGSAAKIIKTVNMYQSRKDCEPITVSKVLLKNGKTEVYLTTNIN